MKVNPPHRWYILSALFIGCTACTAAASTPYSPPDAGAEDLGQDASGTSDTDEPELPKSCEDHDHDGSPGSGSCDSSGANFDCDDDNPDVGPRSIEVCNQIDDDCDGAIDEGLQNLCGGCARLDPPPGQVCGECGGVECDPNDPDATVCTEGLGNACGGCEALSAVPGESCGVCGEITCADLNEVGCLDPGLNACGACGALDAAPDTACGQCGNWECNRDGTLVECDDPGFNACGACGELEASPGTSCGTCGQWTCDDGGASVSCAHPDANGCGGCDTLPGTPGHSCGTCGTWQCSGTSLSCTDDVTNACGGCGGLPGTPGAQCTDECKSWQCSGTSLVCSGPDPVAYYLDIDDDGWGINDGIVSCSGPQGSYSSRHSNDCDDNNGDRYPSNTEVCDGIDNDCDGDIDENDGDCNASHYCYLGQCEPLPEIHWGTTCIDVGIAHTQSHPLIDYTVTGRPNASFTYTNRHDSCGGTTEPPVSEQLDASGFWQYDIITGDADPNCHNTALGLWSNWVTLDGHTTRVSTVTYYNSLCAGIDTCTSARGYCP